MPLLDSAFAAAAADIMQANIFVRVSATILILMLGAIMARLAASITRSLWESQLEGKDQIEQMKGREQSPDQLIQYLIIVGTLIVAMIPINAAVAAQLAADVAAFAPQILTAILVFLLGTILVKGLMTGVRLLIENLDLKTHAHSLGASPKIVDAFLTGIKLLLYLVVLEVAIIQLGISPEIVQNTLIAASYGMVALTVFLGFFGFKDLIQNYAAGIYLRGSDVLEPGKRVKVDDESGEVRDISAFSTTISTDSGYFMLSPNKELMGKEILFKRVKAEIETLEDIKEYFVSGGTDQHGPACAEMALTIFGFNVTQGDIIEEAEEADVEGPKGLQHAIEEMTNDELRTGFVEADKITDISDELKIWFNNGALIIPYFDKSVLFPSAEPNNYVLCVGVEGEEILVVDPASSEGAGGVYYVDKSELMHAIQKQEGGGYVVVSPRGTTAFWRIKNDLVYSSLSLYQQLSKSLEVQLSKILRSGRVLKYITPDSVEDFTERWREEEDHITHMWRPSNSNGANGTGNKDGENDTGGDADGEPTDNS